MIGWLIYLRGLANKKYYKCSCCEALAKTSALPFLGSMRFCFDCAKTIMGSEQ